MHEHDSDHEQDHTEEQDQSMKSQARTLHFSSHYHEHEGDPCDEEHDPSCPVADAEFCTTLSSGLSGCTEIWFSAASLSKLDPPPTPAEIDTFTKYIHAANLALVKRMPK